MFFLSSSIKTLTSTNRSERMTTKAYVNKARDRVVMADRVSIYISGSSE